MQTLILLLCLAGSNSAAFSDGESNNAELSNAIKYLERALKQQESLGSSKEVLPPDYVIDQQKRVPNFFVDQQESPTEDQDESSPKENEAETSERHIINIRIIARVKKIFL